jgi:hypothetical protein
MSILREMELDRREWIGPGTTIATALVSVLFAWAILWVGARTGDTIPNDPNWYENFYPYIPNFETLLLLVPIVPAGILLWRQRRFDLPKGVILFVGGFLSLMVVSLAFRGAIWACADICSQGAT